MKNVRWAFREAKKLDKAKRKKKTSELRELRRENAALRAALIEALELCWDGRIPFLPIERVLRIRGGS